MLIGGSYHGEVFAVPIEFSSFCIDGEEYFKTTVATNQGELVVYVTGTDEAEAQRIYEDMLV